MPDLFVETHNNKPRDMLIQRLKMLEEDDAKLAPFLAIVQSSGYGKTRTIFEVAKERRVVYLLCSDIRGGLQSPVVVNTFINEIKAPVKTEFRERRAVKFLKAVVECAEQHKMPKDLFDAQFTDAKFGGFYDDLDKAFQKATTPPSSPVKKETDEASPKSSPPEPLVVVFDEALCLTEDKEDHNCHSPYRCIRRSLKTLGLIGIFLDTSGKLHISVPDNASSDRQAGIGIFAPPIFEIDTFDDFRNDNAHAFFFGRPLWKMQWEHRLASDYEGLVKFACHKLLPEPMRTTSSGLCALFVCRFGLQARRSLADKLVANHMATLVSVSDDRETVVTTYKSEPILAEAAAYLTTYGGVPTLDVLKAVKDNLAESLLQCNKGDRVEVAAAAWLGLSLDAVRSKKTDYNAVTSNLSREVDVHDFLLYLFPGMINSSDVNAALKGWKVNFTHFCRLGFTPNSSILERCWEQRAALYLPEGEEGIDLLIAIKTETSTFATLRVQVKNYKNSISCKSVADLLQKLDVRSCAPRTQVKDEPFSIALLIQVGAGDMVDTSDYIDLERITRARSQVGRQLRMACTVSGKHAQEIRYIAGDPLHNKNFIGSSEKFREGEWFKPKKDD
jgi:hypothetical protein